MTVTIDEIVQLLEANGLPVQRARNEGSHCGLRVPTRVYVDADGNHSLLLVFSVDWSGCWLEVAAPRAYNANHAAHRGAMFEALLRSCYLVKHVRVKHDETDGEIQLAADMPVMDAKVTSLQLSRLVQVLMAALDEFHEVIRHAMATGEIDMGRRLSVREPPGPWDDDDEE